MSENVLTTPDLIVFFGSLVVVMAIGLWASRREETSEDFFLAGRSTPWWGVAGSIFGSNVSANHMVGMMGIGFSVGFAQAHFELGAIVGLMLLCYGFLPVYRRLKVYTLSHYLGARYDERSRLAYSLIMVVLMAVIQMVPALYIGSRSVCVLLGGDAVSRVAVTADAETRGPDNSALPAEGDGSPSVREPSQAGRAKLNVNPFYYAFFVIALAAVSASYTIWGGLKAVIWTDVIQSVLLLGAGILLAVLTFGQIGGWDSMMALDRQGAGKMHLYLPASHPELPWTGVLTGLMALHCFYWGTNQFIVQRTLSARSDLEARWGIIAAGFLKMLIPFFAIGTGVAAFYLFQTRLPDRTIAPDTAFTELVKLVIPLGTGVVGLIMAGVIGAILSSIDSMMNSAATLVAVDVYKRHVNPKADERRMILVGRLCILFFVVLAALLAIFVLDPNSEENFFLQIVQYGSYLMPGLLVAFLLGMFWRRSTPAAGFVYHPWRDLLFLAGGVCLQQLPPEPSGGLALFRSGAQLLSPGGAGDPPVRRHPGGSQPDRQARPGQGKAGLDRPHRPFIPGPRQGRHRPAGLHPLVRLPRLVGLPGDAQPLCGSCAGSRLDPGALLGGHGKSREPRLGFGLWPGSCGTIGSGPGSSAPPRSF